MASRPIIDHGFNLAVNASTAAAFSPVRCDHGPSGQSPGDQRENDIQDDGEQQRIPRHDDVGYPEQQGHDGRECDDHDQIVQRYLHQRVGRVALGYCDQTNTIAVQGAAPSRIKPAMY